MDRLAIKTHLLLLVEQPEKYRKCVTISKAILNQEFQYCKDGLVKL